MTVTYTTDGGLVGVSFLSAAEGGSGGLDGGFGGGGGLPSFGRTLLAELTSSLILDEGTGGPTWSRATKAWGFNELGYLEELPSGCAFFGGARLVRNNVRTKSEDFSNAAWIKTALTVSGTNTIVCANATSQQYMRQVGATGIVAGMTFLISVRVKYVSGGADFIQILHHGSGFSNSYCNFNLQTGAVQVSGCTATVEAVTGGGFDVHVKAVASASGAFDDTFIALINSISDTRLQSFVGDGVKSFELLRVRSCDVTNYDASYIPEYVSVGVVASPFFGAGIDGAKYFETDWQGAPIAAANLLGFRREAAATNNLLHSRDLSNAAWSTKTNITAAKTATGLDGIANTTTTLTATAADAIILQPITLASADRCASAYVKRRTGTGTISFTQDGGSTWTDITAQINGSTWSRVQITSTLANPSVGFKISTSGDAIDVDCVQNEAGAVATSPIVTTTATVTRNIDMLSYQSASNIDFTVGTCFANFGSPASAYIGYPVSCGNSGRILYGDATPAIRVYDGTTVISKPTADFLNGGFVKAASSWNSGNSTQKLSVDGSAVVSGAFDGSMGSGAVINIASETSTAQPVYASSVAIYNYQMTEAEQQAITS